MWGSVFVNEHVISLQDGVSPLEFMVPITGFPFFHPKDSPTLSDVLGIETCKCYGHFNSQSGIWTITSLPITIKADTKTLQLHSRDVIVCPNLEFGHVEVYTESAACQPLRMALVENDHQQNGQPIPVQPQWITGTPLPF